jgi:hypothetical protein
MSTERVSDAAIAREFWKRWVSSKISLEAACELQRMFDDAKAWDAAQAEASKEPSDAR